MSGQGASQGNGWNEYERLVLAEMKRLGSNQVKMNDKLEDFMSDVKMEMAVLKVKAGMWGAVAGIIPAIATILIAIVLGLL